MWDNLLHSPSTLWFMTPLLGLVVNGVIQTLSYRGGVKNLLKSEFVGFISGLIILLASSIWIINEFNVSARNYTMFLITNLTIYGAMQIWFTSVLGIISVALRVRMLQFISTTQSVSYQKLVTAFKPDELIHRRIERLVKTGQIKNEAGKYYLNKRFLLYIALILDAYKLFLLGKKSEFD
jgi:hypothetical protein